MTEKNVAVIGAGYWGKNLVRNFHQLGALKTVCDGAPSVRKQMGEAYPGIVVTDDVKAVFADKDIQGVVIAAPAALHYELVDKALKAGKHVFVEKPLSLTYADGAKLVKLAAERGKGKPGSKVIKEAAWIEAKPVKDKIQVDFLLGSLEKGEAEVRPLVDELMIKKFRISDKIIEKTFKKAGEA
ncbi:Gfo/Idh/MocA family oxidoreductase [Thermodesulfobacteriota bacterium]